MKRIILILLALTALMSQSSMANEFSYALKLYQDKFYDLAIKEFNDFIKKYPNSNQAADANFYMALAYKDYKDNENALQTFRRTAIDYPKYVKADEAWFRTGEILEKQEKWLDAANAYETVKLLYKKSSFAPEALYRSSLNFEIAEEADKAMHNCRVIVDEYADSDFYLKARLKLVDLLRKSNKIKEAYVELESIPLEEEIKFDIFYQKAKLKYSENEFESSLNFYLSIVNESTSFGRIDDVYYQVGLLHFRNSDLKLAGQFFEKSYAINENDKAAEGIADTYFLTQDFSKAVSYYQKSKNSLSIFKLGMVYFKLRQFKNAEKTFKRVIDSRNEIDLKFYEIAALKRAESLLELNDLLQLVTYVNAILPTITDQETKMQLTIILGETHEKRLESDLALSTYNKFLLSESSYHNNDRILWVKGVLLEKSDKINEALVVYRQIKSKYPLSPYIDKVVAKLDGDSKHKVTTEEIMSKFSDVIAGVIVSDNKADQFFALGKINFENLNNFEASSRFFDKASELYDDKAKKVNALLFKANSDLKLASIKNSEDLYVVAQGTFSEILKMDPSPEVKYQATEGAIEAQLEQIKDVILHNERAIKYYEAFISKNESHPEIDRIKMRLSSYYLLSNEKEKALPVLKSVQNVEFKEEALFSIGTIFYSLDSLTKASDSFKEMLFEFPSSIKRYSVIKNLAEIETKRQDIESAIAFKLMLINEYPAMENTQYKSDIIAHYIERNQIEEAEKYINENDVKDITTDIVLINEFNLLPFDKLLQLATIYDYKGNDDKAILYYKEYLRFANNGKRDNDIYKAISQIYIEKNNYSSAIQYLVKITPSFGQYELVTKNLALLFYRIKDYQNTIKYSEIVLPTLDKTTDEYNTYYRNNFISKIKVKGIPKFQKELESYKRIFPKDTEGQALIMFEYALKEREKKNLNNSNTVLNKLINDYPNSTIVDNANYFKGLNYITLNKFNEAIDILNAFPENFPYSELLPEYYNTMGNLLIQFQKFSDAIDAFKKSLEITDDPANKKISYSNLITVYNKMGLYESVLSTASSFVQLYPTDPNIIDVKLKIGQAYAALNRGPEAITYLKQLKLTSDSEREPEIQYQIGFTYYKMKDFQSAISELIKIPLLSKKTKLQWVPSAYYYAGQSYEGLGKINDAIRMYDKIVTTVGVDAIFKNEARKRIKQLQKN